MSRTKKINNLKNKTHKIKKYTNFRKLKKGGFSFSDITNWRQNFTNWKSNFTEKLNNFSIFKKKNSQSSNKELSVSNISPSSPSVNNEISPKVNNDILPKVNNDILPSVNNEISQNDNNEISQNGNNEISQNVNNEFTPSSNELDFSDKQKNENIDPYSNNSNLYGGYRGYHSLTNLASKSAPFWQPTAKPQVWVGGKKNKKTHRKNKKIHKKNKKTHKKHN